MSRRRNNEAAGALIGVLVVVAVAIVVIKWLLITAAILALPFGAWWFWDREQQRMRPAPAWSPAMPPSGVPGGPPRPPRPAASTPFASPGKRPVATPPGASAPRHRLPLLAAERQVTVTREEDHQDVLGHHHVGRTTRLNAELHPSVVTAGKHRGAYALEVRVDGLRVGELTAAMSTRYRPLVDGAVVPVRCEAVLDHGERGYQLELRLPAVV